MANAGENTNGKIYSCVYIVAIAIQTIGMNLSYHFCSWTIKHIYIYICTHHRFTIFFMYSWNKMAWWETCRVWKSHFRHGCRLCHWTSRKRFRTYSSTCIDIRFWTVALNTNRECFLFFSTIHVFFNFFALLGRSVAWPQITDFLPFKKKNRIYKANSCSSIHGYQMSINHDTME